LSDRNFDGIDSPSIWNDLMTNNSVQNNAFGITFDLDNFSQTSNNVLVSASDSVLHGPMGNVTQVKFTNGTSMTLNTSQNSTVKGVVFKTGASTAGTNSVLCAYARWYAGKIGAISDSSLPDDGTGDMNDVLYNGYIVDAAGNHQRLIMNMTIWLALGGSALGVEELKNENNFQIYPNPGNDQVSMMFGSHPGNYKLEIINSNGEIVSSHLGKEDQFMLNTSDLVNGVYFVKLNSENGSSIKKMIVIH
jgi:hypothetical protein